MRKALLVVILIVLVGDFIGIYLDLFTDWPQTSSCPPCDGAVEVESPDKDDIPKINIINVCDRCFKLVKLYDFKSKIGYWSHTDTASYWISGTELIEGWRKTDTTDIDTTCYRKTECGEE